MPLIYGAVTLISTLPPNERTTPTWHLTLTEGRGCAAQQAGARYRPDDSRTRTDATP